VRCTTGLDRLSQWSQLSGEAMVPMTGSWTFFWWWWGSFEVRKIANFDQYHHLTRLLPNEPLWRFTFPQTHSPSFIYTLWSQFRLNMYVCYEQSFSFYVFSANNLAFTLFFDATMLTTSADTDTFAVIRVCYDSVAVNCLGLERICMDITVAIKKER